MRYEEVNEMAASQRSAIPASRQYAPYIEAAWGFKNTWYPALFSDELAENSVKGVTMAGHDIALRRSRGKVYALRDRCAHRGVKLSLRPMCLTDDTVSCWYHGFTYGLSDGLLKTIVASPDDPLIGNVRIRTYPVTERAGIIFVFVGDENFEPVPPLEADLPVRITDDANPVAHILDEKVYVRGIHRTGNSNWRLAAENGFDPGHLLIHWDNQIVAATDRKLALGVEPISEGAIKIIDERDGPKGIMNMYNTRTYKFIMENKAVNMRARGKNPYYARTSMVLPGILLVEHWPVPGWAQYEWYVPIDDQHHEYWEVLVGRTRNDDERREADYQYEKFFEPLALLDFNDNDLFAREAMQDFYEHGDGWNNESLCAFDAATITWRKVAARFNRGIQEPPETDAARRRARLDGN
jgi:phenylpropionate dioxygenase-like ring-hydroxylating dioxygenase large terminal subunit